MFLPGPCQSMFAEFNVEAFRSLYYSQAKHRITLAVAILSFFLPSGICGTTMKESDFKKARKIMRL